MIAEDLPSLYMGSIRHRRRGGPNHAFSYGLWHALLDLDRIPETCARLAFVGHNRLNLLSFYDRDHMGPEEAPVREKLARWLADHGRPEVDGRIFLLTGLRHFGHVFNPVSFYFCHRRDDSLDLVVAEVNNTFGETFCYLLENDGSGSVLRSRADKEFHVSPFQPVAGTYDFRVTKPGEHLTIHIDLLREGERVFDATLTSRRAPLDNRTLLRALLRYPHQSALTVARIHMQALKLWMKRARFFKKPDLPAKAWRTHHG